VSIITKMQKDSPPTISTMSGSKERAMDYLEGTPPGSKYEKAIVPGKLTGVPVGKENDTDIEFTEKQMWFVLSLRVLSPLIFNTAWLSLSNSVASCHGGAGQNFWWFVFFYDFYYIAVKGLMLAAYFHVFMPHPYPVKEFFRYANPVIFILIGGSLNTMWNVIWWMTDNIHSGDDTWLLLKMNLPLTAFGAAILWLPIYIGCSWSAGYRWKAFKRYCLLVFVVVGDLIFIGSSLVYVYWFFQVQQDAEDRGATYVEKRGIEIGMIMGFTTVYMPLLGKIWWFAIGLLDYVVPMDELKRQRFLYFATVILDMHRVMYSRQIFAGLKEPWVFFLVLVKDFTYDLYQFGLKTSPEWDVMVCMLFKRKNPYRFQVNKVKSCLLSFIKFIAIKMHFPKHLLACFHYRVDCGFDDYEEGSKDSHHEDVHFFCCDTEITLHNLPDMNQEKYQQLEHMDRVERKEAIKMLMRPYYDRVLGGEPINGKTYERDDYMQVLRKPSKDLPNDCVGGRDSKWDSAGAMKCNEMPELEGDYSKMWIPAKEWQMDVLENVTRRLHAMVFLRYRTRLVVKLASSFQFIAMQIFMRMTPAQHSMNKVNDFSKPMSDITLMYAISFIVSDLVEVYLLTKWQMRRPDATFFSVQKFGRIFKNKFFLFMITVCMACCNSDVFLTFAQLKFCDTDDPARLL
jgi:hypothetical protein